MKQYVVRAIQSVVIVLVGTASVLAMMKAYTTVQQQGYDTGYQASSKCYHEWLLEVGYAEYDRKTGEWKLADANTIQGDLIEPTKRVAYTTTDEQIKALEFELVLLRKQQAASSKRRTDIKKSAVDFKAL